MHLDLHCGNIVTDAVKTGEQITAINAVTLIDPCIGRVPVPVPYVELVALHEKIFREHEWISGREIDRKLGAAYSIVNAYFGITKFAAHMRNSPEKVRSAIADVKMCRNVLNLG
jgi:hypothetical protein